MLLGLPEFELLSANTVAEACSLLSGYGGQAKVLAGGTDLLLKMKHKRILPRYLINVKKISGLNQIREDETGGLRIGALTTIQAIAESPLIAGKFPALTQAASRLGTMQIRNLGTLGGNLGNASPSADCAVALLALGGMVHCVGSGGERTIALENLFVGPGRTCLKQDELITEVSVPALPSRAVALYRKHSLRSMDVAIVGAAVLMVLEEGVCREVRIALGAVAPIPMRAKRAEAFVRNQTVAGGAKVSELLDQAGAIAAEESVPINDIRAHAGYRRAMVKMLVKQGLEQLAAQSSHPNEPKAGPLGPHRD